MASLPISVTVNLQESDLEDFYTYNARRSLLMKLLIACALLVFVAQSIRIILDPMTLVSAWKWLALVIALFFAMHYSNKHNARKSYKINKRLHEAHIYIIGEESIHIKGGPFNTIFQWNKLYNVTENKKSFFIWLSKSAVQIVPKREMEQSEISIVSELIKQKYGRK